MRAGCIFVVCLALMANAEQAALKGQTRAIQSHSESYRYELTAMQFVQPGVGWVIADPEGSGDHTLFWTDDDGEHWTLIFKRRDNGLVTAFFLDAKHGWVLTSYGLPEDPDFRVFSTEDSGQHWEAHEAKLRPHTNWLVNHLGFLTFVNTKHGWLDLRVSTSSNFDFGWLLKTDDGGNTWRTVTNAPEAYGKILFLDPQNGWFVGGIPGKSLFQTRDGGASWRKVEIYTDDPNVAEGIVHTWFELPLFADHQRGFLPVRYNSGNSNTEPGYLLYFETRDRGNTWVEISSIDDVYLMYPIAALPTGELFIADIEREHYSNEPWKQDSVNFRLRKLHSPDSDAEPEVLMLKNMPELSPWPNGLNFFDRSNGYLLMPRSLLRTKDGGVTWKDVSPRPQ